MKKLKKIGALLLAVMMLVSLCAVAGATGEEDVNNIGAAAANIVSIQKTLKLTDTTDGIALYAPAITYQYDLNTAALTESELGYDTKAGKDGNLNADY